MSSETGVEFAPDAAEAIKLANAAAENDQHEDEQQQEGQVNGELLFFCLCIFIASQLKCISN